MPNSTTSSSFPSEIGDADGTASLPYASSCNRIVMDLDGDIIEQVNQSWLAIREQIPDYPFVVGELIFRKIFEIAPSAAAMFNFGTEVSEDGPIPDSLYCTASFRNHSAVVVKAFESVVQGIQQAATSEVEQLAKTMYELGARHLTYGVLPAHYELVGVAVLDALEKGLTSISSSKVLHWNKEVEAGWKVTYDFIATAMMSGAGHTLELTRLEKRDAERQKSASMRLNVLRSSKGTSKLSRGKELRRMRPSKTVCVDGDINDDDTKLPVRAEIIRPKQIPQSKKLNSSIGMSRNTSCGTPHTPQYNIMV